MPVYFTRSVKRFTNEEGTFMRLQNELIDIAQNYGTPVEEVHRLFIEVCCSKSKLIDILKGQSFSAWTELEDIALAREEGSPELTYLLKTKGYEEIMRRKKFLAKA